VIKLSLEESLTILSNLTNQNPQLTEFVFLLRKAKQHNNRIWLAGNGGSANLSSHFAHDLMALGFDISCLTDSISRITALINDYSFPDVYSRQLTHFKPSDILILASVHGGRKNWSNNLVQVAKLARRKSGKVLSFLGCDGGELKSLSDVCIIVPSDKTCYVEGLHSLLTHIICERLKEEK